MPRAKHMKSFIDSIDSRAALAPHRTFLFGELHDWACAARCVRTRALTHARPLLANTRCSWTTAFFAACGQLMCAPATRRARAPIWNTVGARTIAALARVDFRRSRR
jgi:hypothetical protein